MKLENYLKKHGYITTEAEIANILGYNAGYERKLHVFPLYSMPDHDLTILSWVDRVSDLWGFLRGDSGGWSGFVCFNSHDDELSLAAQNADFDVLLLKRRGDGIDWKYILSLAEKNCWGFEGKRNWQHSGWED